MASKITTLEDKQHNILYPRTKVSAISDNDGNSLGGVAMYNALTLASGIDPIYVGLDMDLLWTNASPNSNFGAQTISLDLSTYTGVYILYKGEPASRPNNIFSTFIKVGETACLISDWAYGSGLLATRQYSVSVAGVTVDATSTECVPYKIYGIR